MFLIGKTEDSVVASRLGLQLVATANIYHRHLTQGIVTLVAVRTLIDESTLLAIPLMDS